MTERKIQDYLHFYLGCDCQIAVIVPGQELSWEPDKINIRWLHGALNKLVEVKPILRKLSDMTEEEANILKAMDIRPDESVFKKIEATATMNNWLRKNGFDIDGLIESRLAINKSTIQP